MSFMHKLYPGDVFVAHGNFLLWNAAATSEQRIVERVLGPATCIVLASVNRALLIMPPSARFGWMSVIESARLDVRLLNRDVD